MERLDALVEVRMDYLRVLPVTGYKTMMVFCRDDQEPDDLHGCCTEDAALWHSKSLGSAILTQPQIAPIIRKHHR